MNRLITLIILVTLTFNYVYSQKGKDGAITISTPTIVNEFATVINDVSINDTQLTLDQTTLNDNNRFSNNLSSGDLIVIYQAQGASVDASPEPWTGNGIYGLPLSPQWGTITNYNNCGNYEYAEVSSVNSTSTITLRCGVQNNYTASGKVQIIRVPRYQSLTINDSLKTEQWNGNTGGICVIEVEENLTINNTGIIEASEKGFRGGIASIQNTTLNGGHFAAINPIEGGMKGESIAGFNNDYIALGGQYGKGAPANGGGGSTAHNAGGGGGANAGDITNWLDGVGNPDPTYNTAWGLETPSIANLTSSGGGRGGYTYSANNQNANNTAPNNSSWGGDSRQVEGGLGGRPLDYTLNKLFFGGGGGAGELNDSENEGGNGGNAGGIILIKVFGDITGTGKINSNGQNGEDTFSNNPPTFSYAGNDAAGGAGAGGTIKIETSNTSVIGTLNISADGGFGGNQILQRGILFLNLIDEAEGPGGGGGGGYVSIPTNTASISTLGGANGTTNSDGLFEFPANGATSGGNGITNSSSNIINITALNDTICLGNSTTLTANSTTSLPSGTNIIWYDDNYNMIGTGTQLTTGAITNDTTFHVGICPGNTSIAVHVILGASFTADTSTIQILNEHCDLNDGSITGIVINGGALPLTYQWNGTPSNTLDINNLSNGTYQLIVTDNDGCSSEVGNFTILNINGPQIDSTNHSIQNESCNSNNGSISGILVSGGTQPLTYTWNNSTSNLDIDNLSSGNYTLITTDAFGCQDSSGIYTITNIQGPVINIANLSVTDETCELNNGSISNINITGTSSPYTYNWSNGENTLDLSNLSFGIYNLIVTDNNGCTDSASFTLNSFGFPTPGYQTDTTTYFTNEPFIITDLSSNDVNLWLYDNGNGETFSNQTPTLQYSNSGTYEICQTVTNIYNCSATFCNNIDIVEENIPLVIPNIFTPNNDDQNEIFTIQNISEKASLTVYDRWGNIVFSANPYLNNWTGKTNKGASLSDGTYYYIIEDNNESYTGYFSLIK